MQRAVILLVVMAAACTGQQIAASPVSTVRVEAAAPPAAAPDPIAASSPLAPVAVAPSTSTTTTEPPVPTFVVWMSDGLDPGFGELVSSLRGVGAVAVVRSGTLHITGTRDARGDPVDVLRDGFVIPVGGIAIDLDAHAAFLDPAASDVLGGLQPDEVVLGTSSAEIRRLGVGGVIVFEGGIEKTVAAVLADAVIGTTEIVAVGGGAFGPEAMAPRYALVEFAGTEEELEAAVLAVLPPDAAVRVRARSGDGQRRGRSVRPQVFIKRSFGEFAYRPTSQGRFQIDPDWVAEHIVDVHIPLLGRTQCHRDYAALLTAVMQGLIDDGLADVIDASAFRGCWNPRYIAGSTRLSRHAWGVAADINFGNSLDGGPGSPVNAELLRRMAAAGITSGHTWRSPDPGHFEFYGFDG